MVVSKQMRIVVVLSFVLMIVVNVLANALPLNGLNTGQVSDLFPNLFTPAGYTFAIWGLIYLLLLLHVLYVCGAFHARSSSLKTVSAVRIERYFTISSLANSLWIVTWHYLLIPLSMVLIVVMLVSLARINGLLREAKLNTREKLFVRLPFSVYFGWITVATIANACVLLVSLGFAEVPYADLWTVAVLIVGLAIASTVALRNLDAAYALVVGWAYGGILVQHLSPAGQAGHYMDIIVTLLIGIAVLLAIVIVICTRPYREARRA